ncbi:hypothetical protein EJ110_NYTH36677 [Nymphaea thermarum]|nr:hypothetical protein EJ110_NYTH36677 [Nymphaea thermarum]
MAGEIPSNSRISSAIRFLGLLKQPDSDSSALELDEREVVWSADFSYPSGVRRSSRLSPTAKNGINSAAASPSPPSSGGRRRVHAFQQEKSGLSAALAGENRSFVQRKAALDPLLSVSRNIPSPLPVPLSRSGSGSENFSGASGGSSGNYHQSAPVNVPAWPRTKRGSVNVQIFVDDEDEAEDEMLPPHLLVERASARSHVTTFSVFEGVGRTLKGRDLRRVRNAVFHKTGFLE